MKIVSIAGFTPFPGNYFSYIFDGKLDFEVGEHLVLSFSENPEVGIEVQAVQKIKIDEEIKVQFLSLQAMKKDSAGDWKHMESVSDEAVVSAAEKTHFKKLLAAWDAQEFSDMNNHYFELIDDKTLVHRRFAELIGGCLCRPYKFPFNSPTKSQEGLNQRISILSLANAKEQLEKMKALLETESAR